jgi:gamma-glutamylcyclotransferase (GGCT)/AIG2-like uncharacterized protein YtfP
MLHLAARAACHYEPLNSNVGRHMAVDVRERLFVYGTLAPGRPNEHILASVSGTWEKGCVRGHLLQAGWGADQGYPGIVLDASAKRVEGFVLTSDQLCQEWARLDEFEGVGYQRVLAQVELETGSLVQAHIYQLKR